MPESIEVSLLKKGHTKNIQLPQGQDYIYLCPWHDFEACDDVTGGNISKGDFTKRLSGHVRCNESFRSDEVLWSWT